MLRRRRRFDLIPQLEQVAQIAVELFHVAADARGAGDHAHALRNLELTDGLAQLVAFFTLDTARDAAAARIVGHQDQIAAREADIRRQRGAFGAALVLVYLDDDLLAFFQRILDPGAAIGALFEVGAADFFERHEAVALGAIIHERRFETRLETGDDAFVDIALALLFGGRLDIEIDQLLAIDDRDAQFFGLRRIEQHAFHILLPRSRRSLHESGCGRRVGWTRRCLTQAFRDSSFGCCSGCL